MPFNSIFSWLMKKRVHQIDLFIKYPIEVQKEVLQSLVSTAKDTEYGKKYGFKDISSYEDFNKNVPLQDYDNLKLYVDRIIKNEQNLIWPTDIKWFAMSSGTTSDKSKFIPVSKASLEECHFKAGKDLLGLYYNQFPNAGLYKGKNLAVGGSAKINYLSKDSYFGDLSAIVIKNLPWWAEIKRTPSKEIALMDNWEEKIDKMAEATMKEDVSIISGVPSWTMVLMHKILDISGASSMREIWPNLELFMHGGVSFAPYREEFKKLIPDENMHYAETYNASEGFFGIQNDINSNDLLLMLDYGIFYEFIPMDEYDHANSKKVIPLSEVEVGKNYALVISTNGGLWRYIIGDTVAFTSTSPYKIKITGRTKSFINAFGEEIIVDNAEKAMQEASQATGASIRDFTGGPIYMEGKNSGGHEWLIEFIHQPDDFEKFKHIFDQTLKSVNSDYEAKRTNDLTLKFPTIINTPQGTFDNWLKSKQKLGGQHKVPRLSNNRTIIDDVKEHIETQLH